MTPSIGTQLKINIHLNLGNGLTMDDVDFVCQFYAEKSIDIPKSDLLRVDANNYLALVNSEQIGIGNVNIKVTALIPDTDFNSGFRKEVVRGYAGISIKR